MSDGIIQTLIIVVGVLAIAWPLIGVLKRAQNGEDALAKTKRAIEARKMENDYRQIEGRK